MDRTIVSVITSSSVALHQYPAINIVLNHVIEQFPSNKMFLKFNKATPEVVLLTLQRRWYQLANDMHFYDNFNAIIKIFY